MKIMKYLLLAGLCAAVCGANFSACAAESESETRLLSRIKTEYFCRIADIGMEQKRRTYFGDDNFFSEDKIRGIWIKFIKDFIKSNGIGGIKFMSIEYGNFDASKNYSFIVTDKCVYRFHFKYDSITGNVAFAYSNKILRAENDLLDGKIAEARKTYFMIDPELWPQGCGSPRVFCVFGISGKIKFAGCYSIRHPEKETDALLKFLESLF